MQNESFKPDPSQPEGPHIEASQATAIGNSMLQRAAEAVKAETERREENQAKQLENPLQEGMITGVPSDLESTEVYTDSVITTHPTTTVPETTTTTIPPTTTPSRTTTTPTTTPPKGAVPGSPDVPFNN